MMLNSSVWYDMLDKLSDREVFMLYALVIASKTYSYRKRIYKKEELDGNETFCSLEKAGYAERKLVKEGEYYIVARRNIFSSLEVMKSFADIAMERGACIEQDAIESIFIHGQG